MTARQCLALLCAFLLGALLALWQGAQGRDAAAARGDMLRACLLELDRFRTLATP